MALKRTGGPEKGLVNLDAHLTAAWWCRPSWIFSLLSPGLALALALALVAALALALHTSMKTSSTWHALNGVGLERSSAKNPFSKRFWESLKRYQGRWKEEVETSSAISNL